MTLDFDGSVIPSGRYAEGLAVGNNAKKKGQRSYSPLFATVAQTAQVLAALWTIPEAATMRQRLFLRAGRLTRPQGRLCLTMSGNEVMRRDFLGYLDSLIRAS